MMRISLLNGGLCLSAVLLGACANEAFNLTDEDEIVFLAQTVMPNVTMEALFDGRVVVDEKGCLRLDLVDVHTVVWPAGFRLVKEGLRLRVRDSAGREVGQIPGSFRLAGGEVPFLHEGIALRAADRQQAVDRCPGKYWITGNVPD